MQRLTSPLSYTLIMPRYAAVSSRLLPRGLHISEPVPRQHARKALLPCLLCRPTTRPPRRRGMP